MEKEISIAQITVERNDRTTFDPARLQELADSIKQHGLVNPITVRLFAKDPHCVFGGDPYGDMAQYVLIAGERRLRACKLNGLETIKATILEVTEEEAATLMLSENVARADLDPVDEGAAYKLRMEKYGWTITDCAKKAGVSITRIQNRLKLLPLRQDLQDLVRSGNLELGYATMIGASGLDTNFQSMAFRALRDNPNPSPAWFRRILGELQQKAQSATLMNLDPLFSGQAIEMPARPAAPRLPPLPTNTRPPVKGIQAHIEFWRQAAAEWDALGKNFKKDECLAAATALTYAL